MKNKLTKILSSLLIFSFLMTAFSVFSFAENTEDGEQEENTDNLSVLYNREYEEGWDYNNGLYVNLYENKASIDRDEDTLGRYNYFVRYEAASSSRLLTRINFGTEAVTHANKSTVPGTVIQLSLKADDVAKLGTIAYLTTSVGRDTVKLIDLNAKGEMVLFNQVDGGTLNLGVLGNEWVNLAFIFDWQQTNFVCKVLVGQGLENGYQKTYDLNMEYADATDVGIYYLYLGFPASTSRADTDANSSYGMSWCLDNLRVYQGVRSIVTLDETQYGSEVNTMAEKVIDIQEAAGIKSKAQLLEESLAMKVGVDYALAQNARYSLVNNAEQELYDAAYGAPVKQGDNVLVPLQLLIDYIGFPSYIHPDNLSFDITTGISTTYLAIGRDTATVDGERVKLSVAPGYLKNSAGDDYLVIALDDIPALFPGWLAIYDDMGLVIIYEDSTPENLNDNAPIVNRNEDLSTMVDIMKKFVFDTVTDADKEAGYVANGTLVYEDTKANTENFTHPYIIADADKFATLKNKYALNEGAVGYDASLKAYIKAIVDQADAFYNANAKLSGTTYDGIKDGKAPVSTYSGDGYNSKGEMTELVEYASILPTLAFAYQVTGDTKYAKLAYDWSKTIAAWSHWGPGYFTHCAEITSSFAISYDWLYNAYKSLGYDTDALALAIYKNGVHDGYVSSVGKISEHPRSLGDKSAYSTNTDSSNAVGTSGMIIGSLAILGFIDSENAPAEAKDETLFLIGNNIQNLIQYGLDIYAPDGSYIESATYWEYATSNLFRMIMAIDSAAGTDYGFMDTWGLDKTCYYAVHIESSDGFIWNYHDGGVDGIAGSNGLPEVLYSLNTDMFNFVGSYLGDANLLAIRKLQLSKTKDATVYDILFYPFDGIKAEPELELSYHMEAIDGFVTRSDWNDGAIYTGIMGGMNNVTHGQIDSGNFIYHNKGIAWIIDLGTENPYISNYDTAGSRYKYYRVSGEGQNVVIMTDNPDTAYGQYSAAGGYITKTYENEHGSYAILDNSPVYLSTVSYAKRGVMLTNDRSTVILQDEISFVKVESLAWIIHTGANIDLDKDGRTAYLTQRDANNNNVTLRVSIVSQRPDFVFTEQSVNEPILGDTLTANKITGGEVEYSRGGISRLVIESTTISFDLAVVFEIVDDANNPPAVGYQWTSLVNWEPSENSGGGVIETVVSKRAPANSEDIKTESADAKSILKRDTAFTERLGMLYESLANVEYILKTYPPERLDASLAAAYADYLDSLDEYEEFYDYITSSTDIVKSLSESLAGLSLEEEVEEE